MGESDIPPYAELQAGITRTDLLDAINRSGYVFQAEVADCVRKKFPANRHPLIQEEWSYIDSDSHDVRSLDIYAEVSLLPSKESDTSGQKEIYPVLNVLVECKQSDLPYVLFLRSNSVSDMYAFPEFAGVKKPSLRLFPREWDGAAEGGSYEMSLHDVFGCHNLPTFSGPPFNAVSLAKPFRKGGGKKLDISGEETYRGLTLPLLKAVDYVKSQAVPEEDRERLTVRLIVPVAVVRAPLIGVYQQDGKVGLLAVPWARVCRVEPIAYEKGRFGNSRFYDIVHIDYWNQYLSDVLADSLELAKRMLAHRHEIFSGVGMILKSKHGDGPEPDPYKSVRRLPKKFQPYLERKSNWAIRRAPNSLTVTFNPDAVDADPDGHLSYIPVAELNIINKMKREPRKGLKSP